MKKQFTSFAISNLRPGATWEMIDEDYDQLVWTDKDQSKPTKEEVEAEADRILQEYENLEYQRKRAAEYPNFADQLDLLYHGGYDEWRASIQSIKDKYPKG